MKRLIVAGILTLALAQPCFSQSYGLVIDTQLFSAKVVNIDKTRSGKLFVTVEFVGKEIRIKLPSYCSYLASPGECVDPPGQLTNIRLFRGTDNCAKSATLLDSDGNEYGTNGCIATRYSGSGQGGLLLLPNSTSQFVFEFTTPLSNRANDRPTYSLIVPIEYELQYNNVSAQTTLSFSRLSAN